MKKLFACIAIAGAFAVSAAAEENFVNVSNWSDYIADDTVAKFETDTGTKVRYDVFEHFSARRSALRNDVAWRVRFN